MAAGEDEAELIVGDGRLVLRFLERRPSAR